MITTEQFVFIHMHKTGGQTLNHIIERCIPGYRPIGYHYPCHLLPPECADLPLVGIVRNPWDWYISWYAFNIRPNAGNPLFFILSDGCQADFKTTIKNLVNLGSDTQKSQNHRKALVSILPDSLQGNQGLGLSKNCVRNFNDDNTGYYSWLFKRMHGGFDGASLFIGRFEHLEEDFLSIMRQLSVKQIDAIQSEFGNRHRINASHHSHYSCYYNDELRELIAEKEAALIHKFDYTFESSDAPEKTIALSNPQMHQGSNPFQKLLGKQSNYLLLHTDFDVEPIKNQLAKIPESAWKLSGRENRYEVHKQTQALMLIYDEDFRHFNPTYHDIYTQFETVLKPLIDRINDYYKHDGFVVRIIFAKLFGNGKIPVHTDGLYSLLNCHRIHIPIITNDKNMFMVGGEEKVMRTGEVWEINNATIHSVENQSDEERIHLIIDWVPNATVRPEDKNPIAETKIEPGAASPTYDGKIVSRNAPCPCNSGKKFKQCHGTLR